MKKTISNILKQHVDTYGFVSIKKYVNERSKINNNDRFCSYCGMKHYQTIITLGLAYPSSSIKKVEPYHGVLSRYSYGTDYHIVFKRKLEKITTELEKLGIQALGSVDVSYVDERFAAYLSGMGYYGKNQFLIHPKFGSYLYLATILIDREIEDGTYDYDSCGDCNLCITACPGDALSNGFIKEQCISHISQEKMTLNEKEIGYFKNMIYGCDICQVVCPKNKGVDFHIHEEFEPNGKEVINIEKLLNYSNKDYHEMYHDNASSWRGPLVIKRNGLAILYNQNYPNLKQLLQDSMLQYRGVSWYNETATTILKMLERK